MQCGLLAHLGAVAGRFFGFPGGLHGVAGVVAHLVGGHRELFDGCRHGRDVPALGLGGFDRCGAGDLQAIAVLGEGAG
jgi:hypothetical protein